MPPPAPPCAKNDMKILVLIKGLSEFFCEEKFLSQKIPVWHKGRSSTVVLLYSKKLVSDSCLFLFGDSIQKVSLLVLCEL